MSWKLNFKTDVRSKTAHLHVTMHWIIEVEIANPIDELMTSRSITGRRVFSDYDMLDAMIASALRRRLNKHIHFRKRVCVGEQRAQKTRLIVRWETKIVEMIYQHFRATGACEAVPGL